MPVGNTIYWGPLVVEEKYEQWQVITASHLPPGFLMRQKRNKHEVVKME